jgi:hypothetical protein
MRTKTAEGRYKVEETGTIRVKHYQNAFRNDEYEINSISELKIVEHKHEEFDNIEVSFRCRGLPPIFKYDTVSIFTDYFEWYVADINYKTVDRINNINQMQLILIEKKARLSLQPVSNISFNNFLTSRIYNNLFDVVARLHRIAPFEGIDYQPRTRILSTKTNETTGLEEPIITNTEETQLLDKLTNYTDVPEFNFESRNLLECLEQIFSLLGGSVRVVANELGDKVLDINLFEKSGNEITIDNYVDVEGQDNNNNYSPQAELKINNVVDHKSTTVKGVETYAHFDSEDLTLQNSLAAIKTSSGIYDNKVTLLAQNSNGNKANITDNIVTKDERQILPLNTGPSDPISVKNSVQYDIAGHEITGWGDQNKKGLFGLEEAPLIRIVNSTGNLSGNEIHEFSNQTFYTPIFEEIRFNLQSQDLSRDNKNAFLNINNADRINDIEKLTADTQNKINRLGVEQIFVKVIHEKLEDRYQLGDTVTNFKNYEIATRETTILKNKIECVYVLVPFLGILNSLVSVDSEQRTFDVNKTLDRYEIINDYMLVTTNPSRIENTSYMTNRGKRKATNLFKFNQIVDGEDVGRLEYGNFNIKSLEFPEESFKEANVFAGSNSVNIALLLDSNTFTGNVIIDQTETVNKGRYIERGVRYTNSTGQVGGLNITYGEEFIENFSQINNYPVSSFFKTNNKPPLISLGDLQKQLDPVDEQLERKLVAIGRLSSTPLPVVGTVDYNLPELRFVVSCSVLLDTSSDPNASGSATLELLVLDEFNNETSVGFQSISGLGEFNLNYAVNNRAKQLIFKFNGSYKTSNVSTVNFYVTPNYAYIPSETNITDGLVVEKNPNEIFKLVYSIHYQALPDINGNKNVILSDKFSINSRFINEPNNAKAYANFEIYSKDTVINDWRLPIQNASDRLANIGDKIEDTIITILDKGTQEEKSNEYYQVSVNRTDLLIEGGCWSLVGITNEGRYHVMAIINSTSQNIKPDVALYLFASHINPQLVYEY